MPDERTNNGRRSTDALFSKGVKIAGGLGTFALILVTLAFKIYAQMIDFPQVKTDVNDLKSSVPVILTMTCVLYQDAHPTTVPVLCDQAIRRAPR